MGDRKAIDKNGFAFNVKKRQSAFLKRRTNDE